MAKQYVGFNSGGSNGYFYQRSADPLDVVFIDGSDRENFQCHDAKMKSFSATAEQADTWTQLAVNDFPNSPDPRLPYAYDLSWDIKRVSDLSRMPSLSQVDRSNREQVADVLWLNFGIEDPFNNLSELAEAVRARNDHVNEYFQDSLNKENTPTLVEQAGTWAP